MDYTSDSDLSDDTRELVNQGLASVKRKRRINIIKTAGVQDRFSDSIMDTSNVRHPSRREASIGDTLTHGILTAGAEIAISQNHNIDIETNYTPHRGVLNLFTPSPCGRVFKVLTPLL